MTRWEDFQSFIKKPAARIFAGLFIFVSQGLIGWLFVSYPENVAWLRIVFEVFGLILVLWGILGLQIVLKSELRIKSVKAFLVISIFFILCRLIVWTWSDLGYENPFSDNPIEATSTPDETSSSTPTPTKQNTPTPSPILEIPENSGNMELGEFIVAYYETINNANEPQDIEQNFEHLSYGLQGASDHSVDVFASNWWGLQVLYRIVICPNLTAWIELTYFERGNNFTTVKDSNFLKYTLDIEENEWVFQTGNVEEPRTLSGCDVPITNWPRE